MTIALRWRLDQFLCELKMAAEEEGVLSVFAGGQLIRQELVRSASAAYDRAREVCATLTTHAKRGERPV